MMDDAMYVEVEDASNADEVFYGVQCLRVPEWS